MIPRAVLVEDVRMFLRRSEEAWHGVNVRSRVSHEQLLDVRPRDNSPNRLLGRVAVRGHETA
jgi:hypothetical protein